jgi:hypothetical protein
MGGKPEMNRVGVWILALGLFVTSCSNAASRATGVYVLIAVEGNAQPALREVRRLVDYLLTVLQPNDTLGIARVDGGSFNEKDIFTAVTFDQRPSVAIRQKRRVTENIGRWVARASGGPNSDISGGILQAAELLNASGCRYKYILLFSDLAAARPPEYSREVPFQLAGFTVIAFGPGKSRQGADGSGLNSDRIEMWRKKVERGNGNWLVIEDRAALAEIFGD